MFESRLLSDVFNKQAVCESYVVLSHGALSLFRRLEFVGSCAFNLCMSASTLLAVLWYERLGRTAPFYLVAAFSGAWAALLVAYFALRLRGFRGVSWAEAEHALLARRVATTSAKAAPSRASCWAAACASPAPGCLPTCAAGTAGSLSTSTSSSV